jgi:integrase
MPDYRIGRLNGKFVVSWWVDGKRRRYRLDAQSRKEAEAEAIDVIRKEVAKPSQTTVADLWEAYRSEKNGRRVAVAMGFEWKAMGPHFGHLRPDQISVDVCRSYTDLRRRAGKHNGTIWTELGHLRTVLRWALAEAAPRVERPAKPAPKERYLTHAEIDKLLAAPMAHHIKLAILLMLGTAGRVGAILELKWSQIDFERGQINLRTGDTGPRKGRAIVPMNDMLRSALSQAKQAAMTEYVIEWAGGPVERIKKGFAAAVEKAGLKNVSPHTIRHTSAVILAEAGVPMSRIAAYLGHTSTAVTERVYAKFHPEHLRAEAAILDFTKPREVKSG